jgi:alpha-tubulin suppressor-like RCC1 family protein
MTQLLRVTRRGAAAGLAAVALACTAAPVAQATTPVSSATVKGWGTFADLIKVAPIGRTPVPVTLPGRVAQIATSNSTDYALLTNGSVYAWGLGAYGQLGNGGTSDSLATPVRVQFPRGVVIRSIPIDVMPYDTGLAVDTTGHVWGWGLNASGELCLGNKRMYTRPVALPFASVTTLAGAGSHAVYDASHRVYACGGNAVGELGDGTRRSSTTPVRVRLPWWARVKQLVAAFANSGVLLGSGAYYDWGYNAAGQLGIGTHRASSVPVRVPLPGPVRQVFQGGSLPRNGQTLALLRSNQLYAWGDGRQYQLGTGHTSSQPSPVLITPPAGVHYRQVATSGATSYAITVTGRVYAWGANMLGEVGNGGVLNVRTPVLVATGASSVSGTASTVLISLRP